MNGVTYALLNKKIKSQQSIHVIGSMDYSFKMLNRPFKLSAEIYYKVLRNLVPYSVNNVQVIYYGDNKCNGHAAGIADQRIALSLYFTDYFPGTTRWKMSLKLAYADGLPFSAPHKELENNSFRAPAYKRADIGMSFRLLDNSKREKRSIFKNIWLGVDCLNLLGINNVNSYYWITDVTNQQYAVPNYLTGRQINGKILIEF